MELKIKIVYGRSIKRGDKGFKSVLAWYQSETPNVETRTITIDDAAYQLVVEDCCTIAVVRFYAGVIEGFRLISDDNMDNIKLSICDYSVGLRADKYETFNILAAVYDNAEFIENDIRLLNALREKEREKVQAPLLN